MKSKFFICTFCLIAFSLCLGTILSSAQGTVNVVADSQKLFDRILSNETKDDAGDIQNWVNRTLAQSAGQGNEWFVFALTQYDEYNFSAYESALVDYLKSEPIVSASSKLKYALCLAALGNEDAYIQSVSDAAIGEQGLLSWVFGLHLLNNGITSTSHTVDSVTEQLLLLQCADGGWAIIGKTGDVDSTAMTLQALAPYYDNDPAIRSAIDKGLLLLSEKQLADGDYSSYGVPNPESTAQVMVALSALGIDFAQDARFIKNGNTLLDGIKKYNLSDGSFSHEYEGETNRIATMQVFYALVSYHRLLEGKTSLYILDSLNQANGDAPKNDDESLTSWNDASEVCSLVESADVEASVAEAQTSAEHQYKIWITVCVVGVVAVCVVVMVAVKKRRFKSVIPILIIATVAISAVWLLNIQTVDEYYAIDIASKDNIIGQVSITIRCDTISGRDSHIPQNGIILDTVKYDITEGDTVFTIISEVTKINKIPVLSNGDSSVYITSIANISEFDYGDLSGWMYKVNGEFPSVDADDYKLSDGDIIEWCYTCNMGEDLS